MRKHQLSIIGATLAALLLAAATCFSAPMTFPSGETAELSREQLNLLKQQQGLFYVSYPKKDLIPFKTSERAVVSVPEELGGGFLIGFPEDFQKGLAALAAGAPPDANETIEVTPSNSAPGPKTDRPVRLEFALDAGYRFDELKWNIAGNLDGNNPNILSELTWENLRTFQLKLSNTTTIKKVIYLRGYLDYGWIHAGDNQDSDYAGDDRTLEFSRSNNNSDDGDMLDGSIGIGYRFTFRGDTFQLIPLIGYSYHEQNLRMTDGYQTIPAAGSFPGLDSTYETRWYGPWLGVDFKIRTRAFDSFIKRVLFYTTLEGHSVDYEAEADWNLRTDFEHPKSFEHEAEGYGIIIKVGTQLLLSDHWAVNISYDYSYWETDEGTDVVYFSDGTSGATQLNEVIWESHVISLGMVYNF